MFTCKSHPEGHPAVYRPRSKTSEGTSNLVKGIKACLTAQGVTLPEPHTDTLPYSQATHRTLIAQRCASNARPFNIVKDPEYAMEVQMLRPGTVIPSPSTVSRDINEMYTQMSVFVKNHFLVS